MTTSAINSKADYDVRGRRKNQCPAHYVADPLVFCVAKLYLIEFLIPFGEVSEAGS